MQQQEEEVGDKWLNEKGDYPDWNFREPTHEGHIENLLLFEGDGYNPVGKVSGSSSSGDIGI